MAIYNLAWGVVVLPLLGALSSFLAETQRRAALICAAASGLALVMAAVVLGVRLRYAPGASFDGAITFFAMSPPESTLFSTRFEPFLGVHVDALSAAFGFAVTFVFFAVQLYALNALRGETTYRRFFWAACLLSFAVSGFVFSPNLFDSLFMWVAGSAAMYILVSHWWQRADAAAPARRVYVILSIGDVALLLAVVFTFVKFGSYAALLRPPTGQTITDPFAFTTLNQAPTAVLHGVVAGAGTRTLVVLGIVVLFAAMVRAAQVPFHVWLTETATAPVTVIAICAATGTLAGVLLLARMYGVLVQAPHVLAAIAVIGAASAALAAITALAQRDILRIGVLAAVTQLGLAFAALGVGGFSQGVFIAFTSVLFITLFMFAAGNLVRVYRTRNIHEMGGAWGRMRTTSIALVVWAAGVGGLALTTYYALAAAFSGALPIGGHAEDWARIVVIALLVIAAVATALFAFRTVITVCGGQVVRRRGFPGERVAEVAGTLRRPVVLTVVAAIATVLVGLPGVEPIHSGTVSIPGLTFTHFVYFGAHRQAVPFDPIAFVLAIVALLIGAGVAVLLFDAQRRQRTEAVVERFEPAVRVVARGFFLERTAHRLAHPVVVVATRIARFDEDVLDAVADATAGGTELAATLVTRARSARLNLYLAGGLAVIAVLTLLSLLAATGHFWVHTA